jgi:hypothetical protein
VSFPGQNFVRSHTGRDFLYEREDHPASNVWYYGAAARADALTSDALWEIKRVTITNTGETETRYALQAGFNAIWDNRATYFPAPDMAAPTPTAPHATGLNNYGKISIVLINAITWTPLPAVAGVGRNAIQIQNRTGQETKINYSTGIAGYVGMILDNGGERAYDITDNVILYAKSATSPVNLTVEEVS